MNDSPFIVFTVIAAPAVMTNAAAVMSLTTSNRLARAVDRGRALVADLKKPDSESLELHAFHLREVEAAGHRAELLIRALGWFQVAFAAFASATLVALIGSTLSMIAPKWVGHAALGVVVACMLVAVGGVASGARLIIRESRMAYRILKEESAHVVKMLLVGPKPG